MKKILLISLMLVLLATTVCFAADEQVYEPAEPVVPAYVAANYVSTTLLISSGTAEYTAKLRPKTNVTVTKVIATMKLVDGTGKTVQTMTGEMRMIDGSYKLTNTKALTERG